MIKLIDTIKKVFTIKFLLLITAIALFVISVNFTFQSIKKNKIENLAQLEKNKEKKILDSISKPKIWDIDTAYYKKELNFKSIELKTKFKDGNVYYDFNVDFIELNDNRFTNNISNKYFRIYFIDKDNFTIDYHIFNFSEMSFFMENNEFIGANWLGNFEMDKNVYYNISTVKIAWKF
jgi:hypothetical protein